MERDGGQGDAVRGALAALAAEVLSADPFSGAVLVFRAKRADRIKLVLWDGSGLVLNSKHLESGAFRWPPMPRCAPIPACSAARARRC